MSDDILARYSGLAGNPLAMVLMGPPLIELERHDEAHALSLAALAAAPGNTVIRDLARKTLSAGVPAFHLGMLRDDARNACYSTAIDQRVKPGMRVLEIGTGAGLLALLAARAGAEVVTCESNPMIAAAARAVIARNGLTDRVTVVAKRSTALDIGVDMAGPCDLLISEIFGDDLFEEGVVAAIADARARLLTPCAAIVPPRAALRCALVMHDRLDRVVLNDVLGFDLSPFTPLTKPNRHLPHNPSGHVALRSPPVTALAVDFSGEPIRTLADRVAFTSSGGRVDGIAHWLHLDFGNEVTYENAPFVDPRAHWLIPVEAFAAPLATAPGQVIEADVRVFGSTLTVGVAGQMGSPTHGFVG